VIPPPRREADLARIAHLSLLSGAWEDSVPRLRAFLAAHPEVTVTAGGEPWPRTGPMPGLLPPDPHWWEARADGMPPVAAYELKGLLDELDRVFPPEPG